MEEETLKTVDVNDRAAYSNGHHEHIVKQSLITFVNIYWTNKLFSNSASFFTRFNILD